MRGLLPLIQTALAGVFTGIRTSDIFLIPDPDIIPNGVRFPCIGIKDGKVDIAELMAGAIEKTLPVEIYYYDRLTPGDTCILDYLEKGDDISDELCENYLSGYVKSTSPLSQTPIKIMYTKEGLILRRGLFYQYEKEE